MRRYFNDDGMRYDAIHDQQRGIADAPCAVDPLPVDPLDVQPSDLYEDLLTPMIRDGVALCEPAAAAAAAAAAAQLRAQQQLALLPDDVQQLSDPAAYCVGLQPRLHELRVQLMNSARQQIRRPVREIAR